MHNKSLLASLSAITLAFGVASCGSEADEAAVAAPEAPAGITVTDGRMTLPAVAGNPGAVYFTIANASEEQVTIRAVDVAGTSSALLHETATWNNQTDMQELFQLPVMPGQEMVLEPGGKHVMAYEVDDTLEVGGETEVTVIFVGGDKISFPAKILAPGDMGGMDHSSMGGAE